MNIERFEQDVEHARAELVCAENMLERAIAHNNVLLETIARNGSDVSLLELLGYFGVLPTEITQMILLLSPSAYCVQSSVCTTFRKLIRQHFEPELPNTPILYDIYTEKLDAWIKSSPIPLHVICDPKRDYLHRSLCYKGKTMYRVITYENPSLKVVSKLIAIRKSYGSNMHVMYVRYHPFRYFYFMLAVEMPSYSDMFGGTPLKIAPIYKGIDSRISDCMHDIKIVNGWIDYNPYNRMAVKRCYKQIAKGRVPMPEDLLHVNLNAEDPLDELRCSRSMFEYLPTLRAWQRRFIEK